MHTKRCPSSSCRASARSTQTKCLRFTGCKATATAAAQALTVTKTSQLAQLAKMTTLSIDTGDLAVIGRFAATGLITDASECSIDRGGLTCFMQRMLP